MRFIPGPDLPDRRQDRRARRRPGGVRDRPRQLPDAGHRADRERSAARKGIVVTELPYGVGTEKVDRADQDARADQEAAGHLRHQGPHRPRRRACGWSSRSRTASTPRRCSSSSTSRRRWRTPSASTTSPSSTASRAPSGSRAAARSSSTTASRSSAAARSFRRGKAADRLHLVEGLLIAILDIDEVIQLIRTSDDTAMAKERLIAGLRPDRDPGRLHPRDAAAPADQVLPHRAGEGAGRAASARSRSSTRSSATSSCCGRSSPTSWPRSPRRYGTPRRTVLLESAGTTVTAAAAPLEVADDPCFVSCPPPGCWPAPSTTSRPAQRRRPGQPRRGRLRGPHDRPRRRRRAHQPRPGDPARRARPAGAPAVRQRPAPPGRAARSARCCPSRPASARSPSPRCAPTGPGSPSAPARASSSGSTPRCSATATSGRSSGSRTATRSSAPPTWRPAPRRCASSPPTPSSCTSPPTGVRPQGRAGGGMAGVRLARRRAGRLVRRRSTRGRRRRRHRVRRRPRRCPAPSPARSRSRRSREYPAKGRATGGVRCHRFLKGEDTLVLAWAGAAPGPGRRGQRRARSTCPRPTGRRDGSGHARLAADRRRAPDRSRPRPPR